MNLILRTIVTMIVLGGSSLLPAQAPSPVVVELFTSEGCSSCPAADAVLADLDRRGVSNGTQLIPLGEHVDYWNYIGWTDRFSSAQFSQRQSEYAKDFHLASVYTPQMVIDGHLQLVGNDPAEVKRSIAAAASEPKPAKVALRWEGNNRLRVTVQSSEGLHAKVMLAVTEDGLSTQIGGGENGGRTLRHAAVVRELRELGSLDKGKLETSVDVPAHAEWKAAQLKVAALVQDQSRGRIVGAATIDWQH